MAIKEWVTTGYFFVVSIFKSANAASKVTNAAKGTVKHKKAAKSLI